MDDETLKTYGYVISSSYRERSVRSLNNGDKIPTDCSCSQEKISTAIILTATMPEAKASIAGTLTTIAPLATNPNVTTSKIPFASSHVRCLSCRKTTDHLSCVIVCLSA